jgi:hypothetical protein
MDSSHHTPIHDLVDPEEREYSKDFHFVGLGSWAT